MDPAHLNVNISTNQTQPAEHSSSRWSAHHSENNRSNMGNRNSKQNNARHHNHRVGDDYRRQNYNEHQHYHRSQQHRNHYQNGQAIFSNNVPNNHESQNMERSTKHQRSKNYNQNTNELPPRFSRKNQNNSNNNVQDPSSSNTNQQGRSQQEILDQNLIDSIDGMKIQNSKYNNYNNQNQIAGSNRTANHHNYSVPSTSYQNRHHYHQKPSYNNRPPNRRYNDNTKARTSKIKSDLESQREIMDELLRKSQYECIVCCDMIKVHDRTWNCSNCYNVFHLKCIQQWARKSSVNQTETTNTENNLNINSNANFPSSRELRNGNNKKNNNAEWRCPTCQSIQRTYPEAYYCFCGKNKEPETSSFRVPHSCGETCSRNLDSFCIKTDNDEEYFECQHRCTLMCHPGKCPPCTLKVQRICACKKTKMNLNCASKLSDIKCPEICNKILDCQKHRCEKNCHFGSCEPCDKVFEMNCFCGKETKEAVPCIDVGPGFSCKHKCSKVYSCGAHICQRVCHSEPCGTCPLSPKSVSHCHCGQTDISKISREKPRTSCLDPIPICGKICNKQLSCGNDNEKPHRCKTFCHSGDCPPCDSTTIIRCYCGANSQKIDCKDLNGRNFQCKRKCNKKLSCGRHKCLKECCTEKEHVCKQICGRKLVCGQHTCSEQCHQVCRSCPNVIWTEISCNCGAELLLPPLPCGTPKPQCNRPCSRQHRCEHAPSHPCHDDPECPPCVQFVSRLCYGQHEVRNSIPCYETGVSCGRFCQKPLPCGVHKCSKICHDGECPTCKQKCVQIRPDCLHPCGLPCHQITSEICPESPCREKIKIYCECEVKTKEVECNEVLSPRIFQQHLDDIQRRFCFNTSINLEEMKEMVRYTALHSLQCDPLCAKERRNKNLAEALGVVPDELNAELNAIKYSNQLKNEARSNPQFIMNIHDKFVQLIDAFKQSNQKIMRYNFAPMNRNSREIIHNYATYFGLKTESVDKEPNRSVIITANKVSAVPKISLLESVNIDVRDLRPKPSIVKYKTASEESKNKKIINHFDD